MTHDQASAEPRDVTRRSYRMAFILFWSILAWALTQRYVVSLGIVTDTSMRPTLPEGSYVLVNKYLPRLQPPQRGDIVVLKKHPYFEEQYVKRIVGLPGDIFQIRAGQVHINGHLFTEAYVTGPTGPDLAPFRLAPQEYFLLGDNRPKSEDSRHYGPVTLREVDGVVRPGTLLPFR